MQLWRVIAVFGVVAGFACPVSAHHSFAMFDREKTITVSGIVKEFMWTSPHVQIEVVADGRRGDSGLWSIEGNAPSVLARGGWTSTSLRPGDKVSIAIHPSKSGSMQGLLADERELLVNGQPAKGLQWLVPLGAE
jgi:Family of unknown function (DUF6152)